jgi:hypothetical protein
VPKTVTIDDELHGRIQQMVVLVGYGSADECANHILLRVKKAIDEYCDDEEDVREMLVQLGYTS